MLGPPLWIEFVRSSVLDSGVAFHIIIFSLHHGSKFTELRTRPTAHGWQIVCWIFAETYLAWLGHLFVVCALNGLMCVEFDTTLFVCNCSEWVGEFAMMQCGCVCVNVMPKNWLYSRFYLFNLLVDNIMFHNHWFTFISFLCNNLWDLFYLHHKFIQYTHFLSLFLHTETAVSRLIRLLINIAFILEDYIKT